MPQRYWLETYGCQMNFAESNALEIELAASGFVPALTPEEADVVILNTCSVRQTAENRIWGRLGFFQHLRESKRATVILTGCMAERLAEEIQDQSPVVDYVIGTNDKQQLAELLNAPDAFSHAESYTFKTTYAGKDSRRALVPIMNGCNNFCAYCIVPYVRGREVSRDPEEISAEVDMLIEQGVREITLLGQNVNSYSFSGKGGTVSFPDLLDTISRQVPDTGWIRFLSPHPKDFSGELIDLIGRRANICSHIHLPLQSGSTAVLRRMKRRYTREQYLGLVNDLRKAVPDITFSTDILVGFPGEREEDFRDTLDMVERVGFLDAFTYYFNPREGTEAMQYDGHLDDDTKLRRLQELIALQRSVTRSLKEKRIGKQVRVLCEDVSKKDSRAFLTRTEHDETVIVANPQLVPGSFYDVTITRLVGNTFEGVPVCLGKQS